MTVDDGGKIGTIEGEENRPQDRTLRDTTAEFDRIGLRVVDRHRLDAVVQIRLGSDEGGIMGSKCVL